MSDIPSHERLGEQPPVVRAISGFFSEAYERQINGGTSLYEYVGLGGRTEAIALNPKDPNSADDNVRFIISGGSLDFGGFSIDIEGEDMDIKYAVYKVTLPQGNARPIEELFVEELLLKTLYLVSEDGHIIIGPVALPPEEADALTALLEGCELAPNVPEWAKEAHDRN